MPVDAKLILETLRRASGVPDANMALHEPRFAGREWDYVKRCIDTGWVSSVGSFVTEFEQKLATACGVKHALAVVNGTAALHLAMMIAGVKPGDEVIVPTLTFAATANAVAHAGATPHLADSCEATLGIDPDRLETYLADIVVVGAQGATHRRTGRRIAAIVPMHVFGHPVDMDRLNAVAGRFGIAVVEDAAEALGSTYKGRPGGSLGRIAALSFNGNKVVTTGGGGAVLTDDDDLARRARHVGTTAKRPHRWEFDHDEVGYNYRMPNINAALGCAQLEQLDGFIAAKRRIAERYLEAFAGMNSIRVFREPDFAKSNYWLNTLILDEAVAASRDEILEITNANGVMTRPVWKLMHHLPMYRDCPRMDLSVAESLERRVVNVPSSAVLGLG